MHKFKIEGGKALIGDVVISGAKNAALPVILGIIRVFRIIGVFGVIRIKLITC